MHLLFKIGFLQKMFKYNNIKKNIILLLFSFSIFFSYVEFFYLELRFLYLFSIIFIFFEKKSQNIIKISIFSFILFFFHLGINNLVSFKYHSINHYFSLVAFSQIFIISLSIFLVYHFRKIIFFDLRKIFDYFIFIFLSLIFIFNFINNGILLDTLYKCDIGFFYYTRFIFTENSHFSIIANAVILNFIYHIKYYIKNKILFLFNIAFIFFTFGNFSLSFYLASLFSIILIFINFKKLDRFRILLLILFLMLSNFFMFFGSHIYKFLSIDKNNHCISKMIEIDEKYKLNTNLELFEGGVLTPKEKFRDIFKEEEINLSAAVQIYSIYLMKEALLSNPFGYGIHNYKNFREKIDQNIKKKQYILKDKRKDFSITPKIFFHETYMPALPSAVLNYNLNSGSNNFSKIIVEFGIFGILLLILFFITFISNSVSLKFKFILFPLIYAQLFIRGTGYFNSGFLIVSIILIILMFHKIFKKNEK